jgi:hypothetical protein
VTHGDNCVNINKVAEALHFNKYPLLVGSKNLYRCGYEKNILYEFIAVIFL